MERIAFFFVLENGTIWFSKTSEQAIGAVSAIPSRANSGNMTYKITVEYLLLFRCNLFFSFGGGKNFRQL